MNAEREIAYRLDPALWMREQLGVTPMPWQETFLQARRGASILALTARQVGKTTTAAWAIAHTMLFYPGSLSVIACPAQRQSAEAVRRIRTFLLKAGAKFKSDNVYALELENGSRVLALPGEEETIRGLTVDGWIVADEAARLSEELIAALHPMRARCPQARFVMLSTAWKRTDPFWTAWSSESDIWLRLQATADGPDAPFTAEFLEQQRSTLGEEAYNREYLGIPGGGQGTLFTSDLYDRATQIHRPSLPPGRAFGPLTFHRDDPKTWLGFQPTIIAHDVGRSRDRSTAVIGGNCPYEPGLLGIGELRELPQGLYGSARASALARVDRLYESNALIVADLSYDPTYAEVLFETFGERVIGLQISAHGDGTTFERRPVNNRAMLVYTVGRSFLLEFLHSRMQSDLVRFIDGPESQRAYQQLNSLETELKESGTVYKCLPGQHDDLGMSCAMLAWAAAHPHLMSVWMRQIQTSRRPRQKREKYGWPAFT